MRPPFFPSPIVRLNGRPRPELAAGVPRPRGARRPHHNGTVNDVRGLIDQTIERFGRLDAAVNNAGSEGHPGPVTEQTAESYAATFDTNVLGTLLSMKHELRVMQPQGGGSIINLTSIEAHRAEGDKFSVTAGGC